MLKDLRGGGAASKKGIEILNWFLIAVIIIAIATVILKVFKSVKAGTETAGDIAGAGIIQAQTGITPARQSVCKSVARSCENAITRIPFVGTKVWVTDDDVVDALARLLTAKEAALTSTFFREISGDSLHGVVEGGFMVDTSRERINPEIRNALT